MLATIIQKEIRAIIGTRKFALTFGVCSVLIILAFVAGASNYKASVARYEAARAETMHAHEGSTDWLSVRDHRIFLPPQPLGCLVTGIANDIGRSVAISGRGEVSAEDSRYGEDPALAAFRLLDLDFVFQIVLSLLAILFGYDALSGEKERGTLRLTFANPLPRRTYIAGKVISVLLALIVPLLIPLLIGCALLPILGIPLSAGEWTRLALILLVGILYGCVFGMLAVAVSAWTSRSSTSFLVLLLSWIVLVLILPRASVLLAGRAVDVPSIDDLAAQKAQLAGQLWDADKDKMGNFHPSTGGDMGAMIKEFQRYMETMAAERDKKMNELAERLGEQRSNAQRLQERWALGLSRLSPAAAMSLASTELAGTGLDLHSRFLAAAAEYQHTFGKFLLGKTGINPGGSIVIMRNTPAGGDSPKPIDLHELPEFEFGRGNALALFGGALPDFCILILFAGVFTVAAFAGFRNYDVR